MRTTNNGLPYGRPRDPMAFLSTDDLRHVAPSVFAAEAHESRSDRFTPIPTYQVITALRKEGFGVTYAHQSRSRDDSRHEFTKHMLRFRQIDQAPVNVLGQLAAEVTLVNANDGSSAYVLNAGLFRLVCLNGLMVSEQRFEPLRVPHKGDVVGKVIDGTYTVVEESARAIDVAGRWQGIELRPREQQAFAEGARIVRFGDARGEVDTPITAEQLLRPRRHADSDTSLWATFNRVQENCIRGGLHGVAVDDNNRRRRVTTREVRGIDQDVKINRALWKMAEILADRH